MRADCSVGDGYARLRHAWQLITWHRPVELDLSARLPRSSVPHAPSGLRQGFAERQ
jgi:hypothetical protein